MAETPKAWEGQIVEGIFPLRKYLGGSDHSAVFLTEYAEAELDKAAIKLVPAERATADLQLTTWRFAAQLAHPNLMRLLRTGRCRIDGNDLLYLVMEYAEENLGEILPERALTPEETRDMLNPVLDALEYLHDKGLVHGDLKPANILASGDHLKLSSDMIARAGESQGPPRKMSVYDPPEAISGMKTPAGDVWALGTTLVEVLTQKVPEWQPGPNREPIVPPTVPAPFAEIARQCLRLEPDLRISVADVAERLSARAAAASAGAAGIAAVPAAAVGLNAMAAGTGLAATATTTEKKRAASLKAPAPPKPPAVAQRVAARSQPYGAGAPKTRSKYLVPLIVVAVAFVALLTVPRLLTHRGEPTNPAMAPGRPVAEAAAEKPTPTKGGKPGAKTTRAERTESSHSATASASQKAAVTASADSMKPASEKEAPVGATTAAPAAAPAVPPAAKASVARLDASKGEVLDQVVPDVSAKARATIHGHVRVAVKVHVDAAGAVSNAELDSPGPSAFFADLALNAARKWVFSPPEANGKSVPSEWVLHFVFTQGDTKVTPKQTAP